MAEPATDLTAVADLAKERYSTAMFLDSSLLSDGRADASPTIQRSAERLRADWMALDKQRREGVQKPGEVLNHAVNAIFPAPTRVGHVDLGGGIVNAITHRNPFCLLNRFIFTVSF